MSSREINVEMVFRECNEASITTLLEAVYEAVATEEAVISDVAA
ncbi:MAG: hypothetical protein ACI3XA_05615 [Clostridia bacterium]